MCSIFSSCWASWLLAVQVEGPRWRTFIVTADHLQIVALDFCTIDFVLALDDDGFLYLFIGAWNLGLSLIFLQIPTHTKRHERVTTLVHPQQKPFNYQDSLSRAQPHPGLGLEWCPLAKLLKYSN